MQVLEEHLKLHAERSSLERAQLQHQMNQAAVERAQLQHQMNQAAVERAQLKHQMDAMEITLNAVAEAVLKK